MKIRYLIDTSAVVKYLHRTFQRNAIQFLNRTFENEIVISFMTEIELKVWTPPIESDKEVYLEFLTECKIIGIEQKVIDKTAELRRQHGVKIPDAIIAATAICNGFTLVTDNEKDFARINELKQLYPNRI